MKRNGKNSGKTKVKIISAIISVALIFSIAVLAIINQRVNTVNTANLKVEQQDEEIKAAVDTTISGGIKWSIDANGKLYVIPIGNSQTPESGYSKGQMINITNNPPWYSYREEIKSVVIGKSDDPVTVKNGNSIKRMFAGCTNVETIDLRYFKTKGATDMSRLFYSCKNLNKILLNSNFNTNSVTTMQGMFYECNSLETIGCNSSDSVNISSFNTANVTDMAAMFDGCRIATKIELPSTFTANKVTAISYMFRHCGNLDELDLTNLGNTPQLRSLDYMLYGVYSKGLVNLGSINTLNAGNYTVPSDETFHAMEGIFQSTTIDSIKFGENFHLHLFDTNVKAGNFGRGTWRKESNGEEYDATFICKQLSSDDLATRRQYSGTYTKVSSISNEMATKINALNRAIEQNFSNSEILKIEPFDSSKFTITTDNNSIFKKIDDTHVVVEMPTNNTKLTLVNQRRI